MTTMKMLIVRSYGSIMNVENYNTQEIGLAKAFISKGIDTDIVFYGGRQATRVQKWPLDNGMEINIHWLKGYRILKQGIMPSVYELASQYDILWIDEFNQYTSCKLAEKYMSKAYIYHGPYPPTFSKIREIVDKFYSTIFFRFKIAKNVQVFAKSQLTKNSLLEIGFKKVETIGVGLDSTRFQETKDIDLECLGIISSAKVLLYIGTIDERRNTLFLLEVFRLIRQKNSNTILLLIGKAKEKYWKKCMEFIEENELTTSVIHIDKMEQRQLPKIYEHCSMFLFPTHYDIFGMVLMEAMFFGVPVISSNNGGSTTLIKSGNNGYIRRLIASEWAETALEILEDHRIKETIGKNAKDTIEIEYSWYKIAEHAMKYMEEFKNNEQESHY